jgi:predicted component of type VI protein secretion system
MSPSSSSDRWIAEAPLEARRAVLKGERSGQPFLIAPDDQGQPGVHILASERTLIGRSAASDVRLNDPLVSSSHAVITRVGDTYELEDKDSTNGTTLNGAPLRKATRLREDSVIGVGSSWVLFRAPATPAGATAKKDRFEHDLSPQQKKICDALVAPLLASEDRVASVKEIAAETHRAPATVQEHLGNLYALFELKGAPGDLKHQLAQRLLREGLV